MPELILQYYSVRVPSSVHITSQNIGWDNPGQVSHRSPYTGDELIVNRGHGRLFGTVNIGEISDRNEATEVEGWLSSLAAPYAICELPIHRESPVNYANAIAAVTFESGRLVTSLAFGVGALKVGHFIRVGTRTMIVSEILTGNKIVLTPQVNLDYGTVVRTAETVRVKMVPTSNPFIPRNPDWYGPWSFSWIEIPDDVDVDTSHFDTVSTHGDVGESHSDSHADTSGPPHQDSHLDDAGVSHTDIHSDTTHSDYHADTNSALTHSDSHNDGTHANLHTDDFNTHEDTHTDLEGLGEFDPHQDNHADRVRPHGDGHTDLNHLDQHTDIAQGSHNDDHLDIAHVDSHGDISSGHGDLTPHTNIHGDQLPQEIHVDTHTDSGTGHHLDNHIDLPGNHGDAHNDIPNSHVNSHHDTDHDDGHADNPPSHNNIHIDQTIGGHADSHLDDHQDGGMDFGHDDQHMDQAENHSNAHTDFVEPHDDVHHDADHLDNHLDIPAGHLDNHFDNPDHTNVHHDGTGAGIHNDSHGDQVIPPSVLTHEDTHSDSGSDSGSGEGGILEFAGGGDGSDAINPSDVSWSDTDIASAGFDLTSRITQVRVNDVPAGGICIEHTRASSWPGGPTSGGSNIAGNPWVFANIGGTWYGGTYEWLRPGQICKLNVSGGHGTPSAELRTHVTGSPLNGWTPQSGEVVGFMVSTPARFGPEGSGLTERSQIVTVVWP